MVEKTIINQHIIAPIMMCPPQRKPISLSIIDIIQNQTVIAGSIKQETVLDKIVSAITYGESALLVDGLDTVFVIDTKGWPTRSITEPDSEKIVRGPKEGFTESLGTNTSLIRRRIKHPDLKFKYREIGKRTRTRIAICYIDGLARPEIVSELNCRLDRIDIDGVLDSGYIQEMIKDSPLSPFKTIGNTERPDVVAAKLLEGRIAVICDGSPSVLTFPFIFLEYFQSNEDYYNHFIYSTINRLLRIVGFIFALGLPAVYVSLVTFHQEMIPTSLLLSISAARQGVPLPSALEAILMGFFFEITRESSTRMPSAVGQAISIVAALILGEAAVNAKLASAPMVIITALTGITGLLVPKAAGAIIVLRFTCLIGSSFLGLYGFIFTIIGLFIHLFGMRSFGVPYLVNVGSIKNQDLKDTFLRAPWWYMEYRPKLIPTRDRRRIRD